MKNTQRIENIIEKIFAGSDDVVARDLVSSVDLRCSTADQERVVLAALCLCKGDIGFFRRFMSEAENDYRDVLIASGLGFENWMDVLERWEASL